MLRAAFLLLPLALSPVAVANAPSAPSLDIKISRLQGLLNLASSYCDTGDGSPVLRRILVEAAAPAPEETVRLRRFCGIDRWRGFTSAQDRPRGYGRRTSPWWRLQDAAVLASDPDAFARRIAVDYNEGERRIVLDALAAIEPYYIAGVERPLASPAAAMAEGLREHVRRHRVEALLASVARFYGMPAAADVPWVVGMSPLPAGSGSFSATVNGHVIRSFMPVDCRDYTGYASVMVHEVAHVLFGEQPLAQVDLMRAAFRNAPSPNRRYAEAWINEALATAVGNGWAYRRMAGHDDPAPWYDEPVIDAYASSIAPRIYAYLDAEAPLDAALMDGWAAEFDRALPDARRNPDVLLSHLVLATSATREVAGGWQRSLRARTQVRALSLVTEAPEDHVPDEAATILRVEIGGDGAPGTWAREEAVDGRWIFRVRLRDADAFPAALDALVAAIRADTW